jgi:hypothetical protein
MWLYMSTETDLLSDTTTRRFLHIAPERALQSKLAQLPWIDQLTADLEPAGVMVQMDVTDIQYPDDSFDVIYASHVLEHVPDDAAAMSELFRVLRPGGWAILQVPIWRAVTDEDPSVTDPAARTRRFGQDDHVRSYGRDYALRLAGAGFQVTVDPYPRRIGLACTERFALTIAEEIHLARKLPGAGSGSVERLLPDHGAITGSPLVSGRIEQVRDGAVHGWAWRPADPRERVPVRVTLDGEEAATGVAELQRRSLVEAGIGDGRYGFSLPLSTVLAGPGLRSLRVEAGGVPLPAAGGYAAAGNGTVWNGAEFAINAAPPTGEWPVVVGLVEGIRDGIVTGWATSPAAPGWRVGVRAILDGRDIGGDVADQPRRSLAEAGIGDGRCGFAITLPDGGGGPHKLRIETECDIALPPASSFTTPLERRGDPWYVIDLAATRRYG